MITKLNLWRARELTLYGKSLLAKTLGASQLIYTASMICIPDTVINNVQGHLFSFLWNLFIYLRICTLVLVQKQ